MGFDGLIVLAFQFTSTRRAVFFLFEIDAE